MELSVASVILMVVLVGMLSAAAATSQLQRLAQSRREMTSAGESKLEDLRAFGADRTADTVQLSIGGSLTTNVANHVDSLRTPDGRWYRMRWTSAAGPEGVRDVTLRVMPQRPGVGVLSQLDIRSYILVDEQ